MKQESHRHVRLRPGSQQCLSVILTPLPRTFMQSPLGESIFAQQYKIRGLKYYQAQLSAYSPAIAILMPTQVNKLYYYSGLYTNEAPGWAHLFIAAALIGPSTSRGKGDVEKWAGKGALYVTTSLDRSALSHPWSLFLASMPPRAFRPAAGRPSAGQGDHLVPHLALHIPAEKVPKQLLTVVRLGWGAGPSP